MILLQDGKTGKYFYFCKFPIILKRFEIFNFNNLKIDLIKNQNNSVALFLFVGGP